MGRRDGDWFFFGAVAMGAAIRWIELSPSALFLGALAIGWAINEARRKREQRAIADE